MRTNEGEKQQENRINKSIMGWMAGPLKARFFFSNKLPVTQREMHPKSMGIVKRVD